MVLYWLWNLELGDPLFVPLLRTSNEDIQWKLVDTGRQERKDQWKRKRCTRQATVPRYPSCNHPRRLRQRREISECETVACADRSSVQSTYRIGRCRRQELMQPLESRLSDLKARLHGARPIGQQVDGLRGVISRCQKRLAEAETARAEAEAAIIKETEDIASYQTQLAELEPLLTTSTGFRKADEPNNGVPEWVASTLSSIAKHMLESNTIDREAVAQSLLGLMVPAPPPTPPETQQNGAPNDITDITDMCDIACRGNKHEGSADWPQNTNEVRLTTKTMVEETPQLEDIRNRRRSGMSDS